MLGGFGEGHEPDQDQINFVAGLQAEIQTASGDEALELTQFTPVLIKSQVVAGTNYWVKIQVSDTAYIHVKIFKPLPHTGAPAEIKEVQAGKTLEDQL